MTIMASQTLPAAVEDPQPDAAPPKAIEQLKVDDGRQETSREREIKLSDQTNLLPFRRIVPVFLGLSLCILVSTLDSVIVATALSTINRAFNAGAVVSWVPSAYMLTSTW